MAKSGISFKSNFNPKDLEKLLLDKAKQMVGQSNDIPLTCPSCKESFKGHAGLNTCPNCQSKIDFKIT